MQENLERILQRINCKDLFMDHGIRWELKRSRCASWIEISQSTAIHNNNNSNNSGGHFAPIP